jgi:V/A-type H+-transporting ATPase subunit F
MKYFIIGDEDVLLGFQMVGVEGALGRTLEDSNSAFEKAVANKEVAIILITEKSAGFIREKVDNYIFSKSFPLVCEIAGREGRDPTRPPLRTLANEAIGIRL